MRWIILRCRKPQTSFESWVKRKLNRLEDKLMATKAEVLKAISDEKAEVTAKLEDFAKQIQDLKDQIASGGVVTAADLSEIESAVHDIFVA